MEHSSPSSHGRLILFNFLHAFILLWMSTCLESATLGTTTLGNETDRLALLDFKKRITEDPLHVMSSWNDSIDFCSWVGVTCNRATKRVVILNLMSQKLVGSLPPSIGNLTHLTGINLMANNFSGEIPGEMGRLRSLQHLNLSYNSFGGKIPANISYCTQLRTLRIAVNQLIGSIPDQLSSLLNLNFLLLDGNNLSGTIPGWIGNFSSLRSLFLSRNNFQGNIPIELGHLTVLQNFSLGENNLSGMVPSSIYNISSLYIFSVVGNHMHGELPPNVGVTLPNLQAFYCGANNFTGPIPASFSNASGLQILDFAINGFSGPFPAENLGSLRSLVKINFGRNRLGSGENGDLNSISFLTNCTKLKLLGLDNNQFGGELPGSIANLSTQLTLLTFGSNLIYGSIPNGLEHLLNLTGLGVEDNYLGGSVPDGIGKLQKLQILALDYNQFSGPIPPMLGNLTSAITIYINKNRFNGKIPPSLGNCQNLILLDLSSNNLTGTIPKEILGLSSLSIYLDMSNNFLTGSLPSEVGHLVNLAELSASGNKLSGEIPITLGSCATLLVLNLGSNEFQGTIPQSLENLRGLEEIDLSGNNLSGHIPQFLGKLTFLKHLNLSHNDFEGELPKEGVFLNTSGLSILGNDKLCGGISQLHLPVCLKKKTQSSRGILAPKVIIPVACALAFICTMSCFIVGRSMLKKSKAIFVTSPSYKDWKSVSYFELVESTNGFSVDNLIGSGSFGSVYKGVLPSDGTIVAVKVLNLQQPGAFKSFIQECKTLSSIKHRNLLKIITVCSSIDNHGNDFKSLVFEYMVNGSLDMWLHPKDNEESESKRLSLIQRLNIAIDVASALDYLHHHSEASIVHCDMKPSNVLLDEDMVAHIGDFGLARFLLEASDNPSQSQTMSAGLKGSIGYIPPEYGMGGQVSTLGDVYSFGVLLLEMFTGKRPTDDMFGDHLSILQFTAMAMPDHVMDIVDPSLLVIEREDADTTNDDSNDNDVQENKLQNIKIAAWSNEEAWRNVLVSVIQIGLSCTAISPGERMHMNVVVNKLNGIRNSYLNLE
ncbi:LRR receptor-like serine/threonine-protein kinase [Pyrus ussuriensis x Pyrus communis]|uniref:non-specific serine/threonine protein kinase n=1 Tax=Pyrus ussuriensis x Pyrus communis TaxID=2448454 RepID=A0A5N5HV69_9ROSA|nr:LRR receptor-like serine/threonine-protein kinase [Pyrus ussuriensis x Pyrus communis]